MMSKKILVVEDDENNLELLIFILEKAGYSVQGAENGKIALDQVEIFKPDLILMDLRMPVMDGFETIKILKNDANTAKIPTICISAHAASVDVKKALDAGFDAQISKPFEKKDLLDKINEFLS
ncbi:response regulator [Dolichospermum sp. ST_sed1]|nr:response regulator [Dolichospermum sp. ST_sed1]